MTDKYKILKEFENNLMLLTDLLGSKSTDNEQLLIVGRALFDKKFKGVYSSDQIPKLKNNEMCIVNTDDSSGSGVHWISLYRYKNKTYFYDSFSRSKNELSKFWKNKTWIEANIGRDQSYDTEICGAISMAWLISFDKYKTKVINII